MNKVKTHTRQISSPHLYFPIDKILHTPERSPKFFDETSLIQLKVRDQNITQCMTSAKKQKQISSPLGKFYSFKKIREDKVREKDQKGKVIHKVRVENHHRFKTENIDKITTLNDARTISSVQSSRNSDDLDTSEVCESQILSRGCDLFPNNKIQHFNFLTNFKKNKSSLCKINHPQLNLLIDRDSGWLCHYQISDYGIDNSILNILKTIPDHILQLYSQNVLGNYRVLMIFQAYDSELNTYMRNNALVMNDILNILIQVIVALMNFRDRSLYPIIKSQNIVLSSNQVKIKITEIYEFGKQQEIVADIGKIGKQIINNLQIQSFKNITKFKELKYKSMMNDFIDGFQTSLESAYERLKTLKDI